LVVEKVVLSAYSEDLYWACQSAGYLVEKWVGLKVVSWVEWWVASKAEMMVVWLVVCLVRWTVGLRVVMRALLMAVHSVERLVELKVALLVE
jgi:hypothetical protein